MEFSGSLTSLAVRFIVLTTTKVVLILTNELKAGEIVGWDGNVVGERADMVVGEGISFVVGFGLLLSAKGGLVTGKLTAVGEPEGE